jgi:hypothetical protein
VSFYLVSRPSTITCIRHLKINTRRPPSRPDLLRFIEDIALPVLEKPLPDPVEDCYREQIKNKILLDQEDIELVRIIIYEVLEVFSPSRYIKKNIYHLEQCDILLSRYF